MTDNEKEITELKEQIKELEQQIYDLEEEKKTMSKAFDEITYIAKDFF